jgi:hypothetical protein
MSAKFCHSFKVLKWLGRSVSAGRRTSRILGSWALGLLCPWPLVPLASCALGLLASCALGLLCPWPLVPLSLGLLGPRAPGHLGSWATGLLGSRAPGPLGYWASGPLGSLAIGLLGHWAPWPLGSWAIGLLGHWAPGPLGSWAIGLLGHWAPGPLGSDPGPLGPSLGLHGCSDFCLKIMFSRMGLWSNRPTPAGHDDADGVTWTFAIKGCFLSDKNETPQPIRLPRKTPASLMETSLRSVYERCFQKQVTID